MARRGKGRPRLGGAWAIVVAALTAVLAQTPWEAPGVIGDPTASASTAPAATAAGAPEDMAASFSAYDGSREPHATFSDLDGNLRCGPVFAVLDEAHMGSGERPDISGVEPSGWRQKRYDGIDGGWLYNRCHLLGDQLWNDDSANWKNLVTGTRQMNVEGMLPIENEVASHLRSTGHLVMYQVTPLFEGEEAVCRAVRMEASCLEGDLKIDERVENVQDGTVIDCTDGSSRAA